MSLFNIVSKRRVSSAVQAIYISALTLGLLLLFSVPSFAQLNLGRLYGAVMDQSGGVVVGATVTVIDVARGISRTLNTDSAGEYNAPSLLPGTYTVRAEAAGFQTYNRQNVAVGVGQEVRVDLVVQPGQQTQTITVTEALPTINASDVTLGGTLENQQIAELPVNGRSYVKLMDTVPGSVTIDGNDFNFNGARSAAQVYMFDGIDQFNFSGTGPLIGGTAGFTQATILPLDAINQVNLETNPKAEFGWKSGGVVNIGVKSGTNDIHGTAFAMGRDTVLDARTPFSLTTPTDNFEQFGATVGGPIKKDKIFYFAAYEGQRYLEALPYNVNEPAALAGAGKSGSFPTAILDMEAHGITPAPLSLDLAGCTQPLPVSPTAPTCTGGIFNNPTGSKALSINPPNNGGSNNGLMKIDYHVNDKNSINGEYLLGNGSSDQVLSTTSVAEPWWVTLRQVRSQIGRGVWIWTPNSSWLNEMRFGINRQGSTGSPAECTQNLGQPNYATTYNFDILPVAPPECGFPVLAISGFVSLGSSTAGGGPQLFKMTTPAGVDSVSYTHGKHQFKFGFEIHDQIFNGNNKMNYIFGLLKFGSISAFSGASPLEDFLAGQVGSSMVLVGNSLVNIDTKRYATFAQDDWRITPRLTLNLGLRWEIVPPFSADPNQLGSFSPTQGMEQVGVQIKSLYGTDWKQFGPRVGVAWDVTGSGKTVVRAGGGITENLLYFNSLMNPGSAAAVNVIPTGWKLFATNGSQIPSPGTIQTGNLAAFSSELNWAPNSQIFNTNPANLACGEGSGTGATVPAGFPSEPAPCNIGALSQNLRTGYVETWTLNVQHAFTNNIALNVGYVGTRGVHLTDNDDINQPLSGLSGSGPEQTRRPYFGMFPYLGTIDVYTDNAWSSYNGLQAALKMRNTHGLTMSANYTYSHTLDIADGEYGAFPENSLNPALDYGNAGFDFRHNLSLNFTYDIPGRKAPAQMLEGWEINSVVSVLSTAPLPAVAGPDLSGTGEGQDRWTLVGNPNNITTGKFGEVPCYSLASGQFAGPPCTPVQAGTGTQGTASFVQNFPAGCISAAMNEATNPTVLAGGLAGSADYNGLAALADYGCYDENGTVIVPPAQGTYGNMARDVLRFGLPFREWDFSVTKIWKLTERVNMQFRVEAFNVTNTPVYTLPSGDPSVPSTFGVVTSLNNSGDPILGTGGPRQFSLYLKFIF